MPSEAPVLMLGITGVPGHISAVTLPKGVVSAIDDRDFTVATIVAPSAMKSEEEETAAAEGEVPTVGEEGEAEGETPAEGGEEA